jgi:hypothetical protein
MRVRTLSLVATLIACVSTLARAEEKYREPPSAIRDVLRAPALPIVDVSPDGRFELWARPVLYPPIAELAAPMLRLAGVRIDPRNNGFHHWSHYAGDFTLKALPDGKETSIKLPKGLRFGGPYWNADASAFAFVSVDDKAIGLWVVDTKTATAHKGAGRVGESAARQPGRLDAGWEDAAGEDRAGETRGAAR